MWRSTSFLVMMPRRRLDTEREKSQPGSEVTSGCLKVCKSSKRLGKHIFSIIFIVFFQLSNELLNKPLLLLRSWQAKDETLTIQNHPPWPILCCQRNCQNITGNHQLPSPFKDMSTSCGLNRARNIAIDNLHPRHHLCELLPSGRRYKCIKSKTNSKTQKTFPSSSHKHAERKHKLIPSHPL